MSETDFGRRLRAARRAKGMTQEELAAKARLSAQAVSMLERGARRHPQIPTVQRLADALGLVGRERKDFEYAAPRLRGLRRDSVGETLGPAILMPRCLPAPVCDFAGRTKQVRELHRLLAPGCGAAQVVVSAIGGMGGVGKTALALHVGHQLHDAYPDGQLYLNLRGFGPGEPMTSAEGLGVLLGSLGASSADIPDDVDQGAARYRSLLAGKRVLIVLDNAATIGQIDRLLPGEPGCAAVVTSRRTLTGLPGAHHLELDVLSPDDAVAFLAAIAGAERVGEEESSAERIVRLCGQLPLAIRIAGGRLSARANWTLSAFADRLESERGRLNLLEARDVGVRASFAVSVSHLARSSDPVERAAARALPLLGLLEMPDLGIETVARLIDKPIANTERILDRLASLHLVDEYNPGRFRMHDLVRTFATELAHQEVDESVRIDALVRVLKLHNTIAWQALRDSNPTHVRLSFMDPAWVERVPALAPDAAEHWLSTEWRNLVSLVEQAGREPGVPSGLVTQVAIASLDTFHSRALWAQWMRVSQVSLQLAEAGGDAISQAIARYDLGGAQSQLGHNAGGERHLAMALVLFREAGSSAGEAMVACYLAHLLEIVGRYEEGIRYAEHGLGVADRGGYRHLMATSCLALGMLYGRLNDRQREQAYSQRSLEVFEEIEYQPGRARALYNMGLMQARTGRASSALRLLLKAARLCDLIGLAETAANARAEAAAVRVSQRRPDLAIRYCEEALIKSERAKCELGVARSRVALGCALQADGRPQDARAEWRSALTIYTRHGAAAAEDVRGLLVSSQPRSVHRKMVGAAVV